MATSVVSSLDEANSVEQPIRPRNSIRMLTYFGGKVLSLMVMVSVSVFLIILIGNFGGYIDKMVMGEIDFRVGTMFRGMYTDLPAEERLAIIDDARQQMYENAGLNEPFLQRAFRWFWMAIRLDFGSPLEGSPFFPNPDTSITIAQMLLARLPATLTLFGFSNLVIFISSVAIGVTSSQRYGSRLDNWIKKAAPLSSIPAWFYGVLISILLFQLKIVISEWLLLFIALFLGSFFHSAYTWRSFFIIYSTEDYLEFAQAQGLPRGKFIRRYLIRPALPTILTNFSLSIISFWVGSIILEPIFGWPGIGQLFLNATFFHDTSILVSVVVVYAYILAITIFLLDISVLIIDPRLRIKTGSQRIAKVRRKIRWRIVRRSETRKGGYQLSRIPDFREWVKKETRYLFSHVKEYTRTSRGFISEINKNPPARRSFKFILFLLFVAILIVITIPYKEAISQWRGDGNIFIYQPRDAQSTLANWFREEKLPPSIILNTSEGKGEKTESYSPKGNKDVTISFPIEYTYSELPQDIVLFFDATFSKQPLYNLYWLTPDGTKIKLADFTGSTEMTYYVSQKEEVQKSLKTSNVREGLFMSWAGQDEIVQGEYNLIVEAFFFEPDAELDIELVIRGQVFGLLGTDNNRRDIMIEILWGLPIVLTFGFLGAILSNFLSMLIAAVSAWYGGWLDNIIQRITEINMALPAFPISLLVFYMYSKSIWVILLVIVLLSIFGTGLKSYRSTFLEVRESPYIEAAVAYGAKDRRIIFRYLVPRIVSVLVPKIIVDMPSFVFMETSLAYLGLSDPVFPTWGKLILGTIFNLRGTSYSFSPENMFRYTNLYIAIIFPVLTLIFLAISFNTLGSYLEKHLNPKLRET